MCKQGIIIYLIIYFVGEDFYFYSYQSESIHTHTNMDSGFWVLGFDSSGDTIWVLLRYTMSQTPLVTLSPILYEKLWEGKLRFGIQKSHSKIQWVAGESYSIYFIVYMFLYIMHKDDTS